MPTFNGKFYRLPTVAVKTDLSSFVNFGLAPGGIVAIIGPAEGGEPDEVVRFTDPNTVKDTFRGGDLVTAAEKAYEHGAQIVYCTRAGAALQSTSTIVDATSADIGTIDSIDYGSYVNSIAYKIESGTVSGKKMTVKLYDPLTNRTTIESIDNAANLGEMATYFENNSVLVTITASVSGAEPENIAYTDLASGSDGTPLSVSDWSTALNLYITEFVNILHPAGSTDATVHALFQTHVETYSTQKRERTAIVGAAATDPIGDVDTENSLVYRAYTMNSDRMVLVAPGTDQESGAYTAAKVLGLAAGNDVATPMTYKTITATSIAVKYTESEKDTLVKYGVCTIEEVPQGRRIVRGITTVQDPSEFVEDTFKEYSTLRIKDYITDNVRTILETTYIGKKGVTGVESQMQSTTTSVLSTLKESQIIQGYQNIVVTKDANDAKVFYVTYQVAPVSPINWIFVTQVFVNSI